MEVQLSDKYARDVHSLLGNLKNNLEHKDAKGESAPKLATAKKNLDKIIRVVEGNTIGD